MTKKLWMCCVILAAGALLAAGAALYLTPSASASNCFCDSENFIGTFWGLGPNCDAALNDAINNAQARIACPQGTCAERYDVVTPCEWSSEHNAYRTDIDYYARCLICF